MVNLAAFLLMYCGLTSVGPLMRVDPEATVAHHTQQSPFFVQHCGGAERAGVCCLHSMNQFPETPMGRVLAEGKVLGGPPGSLPCAVSSTQQRELLT